MAAIPSISNFHLRYRLWIAELNFDINVLRILSDHLHEVLQLQTKTDIQEVIASFEKKFTHLRNEIDELKNDMHLAKMQLAAHSREKQQPGNLPITGDTHASLAQRYKQLREKFESIKKEVDKV